jgi:alpha-beta hydrolase superfamily lysophospholipase
LHNETNVTVLQLYPGYYHEVHNELPEFSNPVKEEIRDWILARIKPTDGQSKEEATN